MKKLAIIFLVLFTSGVRAEDSPCGPGYGEPVTLPSPHRVDFSKGALGPVPDSAVTIPFPPGYDVACVSQIFHFDDTFDFNKAGKLPIIFGGAAPTGCVKDVVEGFTVRPLWRRNGEGQIQFHDMDEGGECGQNQGRGRWTFPAGQDVEIGQEIVLNTPGLKDGILRIWVDGKMVIQRFALLYRRSMATKIDGVMASTYFSGPNSDWASPKAQGIDFGTLRLWRRTDPLPPQP